MDCVTLSETLVRILRDIQAKGITISTIASDGASYQVNALNFEDEDPDFRTKIAS
jgi:hypothetical protein